VLEETFDNDDGNDRNNSRKDEDIILLELIDVFFKNVDRRDRWIFFLSVRRKILVENEPLGADIKLH